MDKMSKEVEARVIRAIEDAIEDTNGGAHPSLAIRKQAESNGFGPQVVQRMVEAYNTSKTLAHLKSASGHSRADNFQLANAADILGEMYPADVVSPARKVASFKLHSDYVRPEQTNFMRKGAGASPPPLVSGPVKDIPRDPELIAQRNYDIKLGMEKKVAAVKSLYRQSHYKLWSHVKNASEHFRTLYSTPFADVEIKVAGEYGAVGRSIMNLIYEQSRSTEKRAELKNVRQLTYDVNEAPYSHIAKAVKVATEVYRAAEDVLEAQESLDGFLKQAGLPMPKVAEVADPEACLLDGVLGATSRPFEKNALLPTPQLSGPLLLAGGMGMLGLEEPDAAKSREKAELAVADPMHEATMKSIQTQSIMNDFITNDPIISSYDPDEVRLAFNNVTNLSPSLATQPGVMRAMLRRMLQQEGVIEPHEATQLTDVEKNLRQLERATSGPGAR